MVSRHTRASAHGLNKAEREESRMCAYIECEGGLSFFARAAVARECSASPSTVCFKYHGLWICNQRLNESFEREQSSLQRAGGAELRTTDDASWSLPNSVRARARRHVERVPRSGQWPRRREQTRRAQSTAPRPRD